jgi:hypothetical protein
MHPIARTLTPILVAMALASSSAARAQVLVSITVAPPPLPVYVQPVIPAPGFIWSPGYWAWGPDGYFWVPGTWIRPPVVGLLWTPGYWGWSEGIYVWHTGYWGPRIGFYGGVNYGFGYTGVGFQGGYWRGGVFTYNRAVTNVGSVQITNVYSKTVITNTTVTNVSFNGGNGGTTVRPTAEEVAAGNDKHIPPTSTQSEHEHSASTNHALLASVNHGSPAITATPKAGQFSGHGVVGAAGAKAFTPSPKLTKDGSVQPHPKQANTAKAFHPPAPHQQPPHQAHYQAKKPQPHPKSPGGHP